MLKGLKRILGSWGIGGYTGVFVFVWLAAWTLNAVWGMRFDLDRLKELFTWVVGYLNATHLIDSKWNSPQGEMPKGEQAKVSHGGLGNGDAR